MSNELYKRGLLIKAAASLARGDALGEIYKIADKQKTISTEKLNRLLDDAEEKLRDCSKSICIGCDL